MRGPWPTGGLLGRGKKFKPLRFVHNKYGFLLLAFLFAANGYTDDTLLSVNCQHFKLCTNLK